MTTGCLENNTDGRFNSCCYNALGSNTEGNYNTALDTVQVLLLLLEITMWQFGI